MVEVIEVLGDISAAPFPNILGNQIPNETKYVEIKKNIVISHIFLYFIFVTVVPERLKRLKCVLFDL